MKKAQNILLAGSLAIGSIFTANAQSNNNDAKLLADASIPKKEITENKADNLHPLVREGDYVDALRLSRDEKILVVFISGANGTAEKPEPFTAKEHGEIIQPAFKNQDRNGNSVNAKGERYNYTDNPTDIVVVYTETGENRMTTASVLINGKKFQTKSGRENFPVKFVGKYVDVFADEYAKVNGIAFLAPSSANGLALNKD